SVVCRCEGDRQEREGATEEAWQATTRRQGFYYWHLSDTQKRRALDRGWKLVADLRAEEGDVYVGVDFVPLGNRFDVNVLVEPGAEIVRLNTVIGSKMQGLDWRIETGRPEYHHYELTYDPNQRSAELWRDEKKVVTGYHGHQFFRDNWELDFGLALYKSS